MIIVAWMSIIESVSNITKEGNGIKYKNRRRTMDGYINIDKITWENETFPSDKFDYVKKELLAKLNIIREDLSQNYGPCIKRPKIFLANCLQFDEYFTDQILVIDWITKLQKEGYPEGIEEPESKLVTIIERVRAQTRNVISRRNPRDTKLNYDQIFKKQLTFRIKLEPGHVRYRLTVLMKKSQTED